MLGDVPTLVGIDGGAKMGKSLDNAIFLSDDEETITRRVMSMFTDPNRVRADIPGRVEGNPVFIYHDAFNPDVDQVASFKERYRRGMVGDVTVKRELAAAINGRLEPLRERRTEYESQPGLVDDILVEGIRRVRGIAQETMEKVYDAMGLYGPKLLRTYSRPISRNGVPAVLTC
jgi:tryptophanyl-tRNA synthetase